jgi:tetratricopeptide (TPR) repeat protein
MRRICSHIAMSFSAKFSVSGLVLNDIFENPKRFDAIGISAHNKKDSQPIVIMTATSLKQDGDDLYKQGKYREAIAKYTSCIDRCADPAGFDLHLAYSNRCACFMHTNQYERALEDANVCVAMKPAWVKGYSRKAACLEALSRTSEAITAYQRVLQLDRNNVEASQGLLRLRNQTQNGSRTGSGTRSDSVPGTGATSSSMFDRAGSFMGNLMTNNPLSKGLDFVTFWYYRCMSSWQNLSPQTRLYIQCGLLIAVLYYWFFRPSGSSYYDTGYGSSGYGGYGYSGYSYGGGGMSWTTWGAIMLAAYKVPPMFPDLLGDYARPFFGMSWTTFMWLLNMFSRNTGRMGGFGGYGGGMPGGMFGQRRRYY